MTGAEEGRKHLVFMSSCTDAQIGGLSSVILGLRRQLSPYLDCSWIARLDGPAARAPAREGDGGQEVDRRDAHGPIATLAPRPGTRGIGLLAHRGVHHSSTRSLSRSLYVARYRGSLERHLTRAPDIVYWVGGGYELFGGLALHLARSNGVPLVVWPAVHPGEWGDGPADIELLGRASAVIAMSEYERDHLVEKGLDRRRIHVIRPGGTLPDNGDGRAFRRANKLGERILVSFVGRRTIRKGLVELIAATEELRRGGRVVLCVAGPEAEVRVEPAPGVLDLGVASQETLANLMCASDILCVPSEAEAYGLVYVDAWAYGCAVVAGSAPAVRELVRNGVTGFTVSRDAGEIRAAIAGLVERPEERRAIGAAGRENQRQVASWAVATGRHLDLFAEFGRDVGAS